MHRRIRFSTPYLSDARRVGVRPGTDLARDVARVIVALENADTLPAPGDSYTFVPDPDDAKAVRKLAHVRRVPGRNLWVWYQATTVEVELVALGDEAP